MNTIMRVTNQVIEDYITAELIRELLRDNEKEERDECSLEVKENIHSKAKEMDGIIYPLDPSIKPIEPKPLRKAYRNSKPLRSATIKESNKDKVIAIEFLREINGKVISGALWLAPYLCFKFKGTQFVIKTKTARRLLYDNIRDTVLKPLPNGFSILGLMNKQLLLDHCEK